MHDPTRPSTEERYSAAVESSDMQVLPTRCSVDYLVAAGWIQDSLGATLYRLRTEWDNVRAELRLAEQNASDRARDAAALMKAATVTERKASGDADASKAARMMEDVERTRDNAQQIREEVERAALTARALAMVHLKTLRSTSDALHQYAIAFGVRARFFDLKALRQITPRALQLWLDPTCPHCAGRGFNGGFREAIRWCQECDKTGKRVNGPKGFRIHRSQSGHKFGRALLVEMDRKCERVEHAMRMYLHSQRGADEKLSTAQAAALKTRLAELRSAQAQED